MSKRRLTKFFRHATFTAAEWQSRNPLLRIGEIGFELTAGQPRRHKVGPGFWNDLPYEETIYPYEGPVTTPIGDATGNLSGLTVSEVLYRMLNAYRTPVFTSASNNGGSGFANIQTREVGHSLSGPITVTYGISNSENLSGSTPVHVNAGGVFSNEGSFAHTGSLTLNLTSPLTPASISTVIITLTADHEQGSVDGLTTEIRFWPRLMWLSTSLSSITNGAAFMSITNRQSLVTNTYERDYEFPGSGYGWIGIPEMLGPTSLKYADVTNPLVPLPVDMMDMGSMSINNGVATYIYRLLRTQFNLLSPIKLRVASV